jgi:hypothetical protein
MLCRLLGDMDQQLPYPAVNSVNNITDLTGKWAHWSNSGMPVIVGNQQFLFMREACSTGRKSCLVLLTWSKVYNLSNSGKGESITVVLLNGHRVKCFLNIYVCTKINGALCPCQRSPCLQWIMGNREPQISVC